ncbi:MAG: sulfur carrier protein ThiS [Acidimicrobiales bacterium]|nr:sulfur carrier protein ThiS [Acidimicrobiales bacterium]
MIEIRLNGEAVRLADLTNLRELVSERVERVEGVAVARNDEVVPRSEWADAIVVDGDRIEILVAAQGG